MYYLIWKSSTFMTIALNKIATKQKDLRIGWKVYDSAKPFRRIAKWSFWKHMAKK